MVTFRATLALRSSDRSRQPWKLTWCVGSRAVLGNAGSAVNELPNEHDTIRHAGQRGDGHGGLFMPDVLAGTKNQYDRTSSDSWRGRRGDASVPDPRGHLAERRRQPS